MLEQLGATTLFSCEGHPNGFYVLFDAALPLAVKLKRCGYFTVELEGRNRWSLRINNEIDETTRKRILRLAAASWEKTLGPLNWKKVKKENCHAKLVQQQRNI